MKVFLEKLQAIFLVITANIIALAVLSTIVAIIFEIHRSAMNGTGVYDVRLWLLSGVSTGIGVMIILVDFLLSKLIETYEEV